MDAALVNLLICTTCRGRFTLEIAEERDGRVLYGGLLCPRCATTVPICAGFPIFDEAIDGSAAGDLERIERERMGDAAAYASSVEHRYRRPEPDADAASRPFSAATQALLALVPLLRRGLNPGDVVIDLDCRTGWSSELLASLFPRQRIVSVCNGTDPPLGHAGWRYWLGEGERAANLDVVFRSAALPLPFGDASIGMVHGFGALSRDTDGALLAEVLRVLRADGAAVFPEAKLNADQRAIASRLLDGRKLFMLSQAEERLDQPPLDPVSAGEARAIVNPAWNVDLHLAAATLGSSSHRLSQAECELLFWADRAVSIDEIARRTKRPQSEVAQTAVSLAARGIVEVRAMSRAIALLQRFYTKQTVIPPPAQQTLQALWRKSRREFAARRLLTVDADGSVFTYADAAEISLRVAAALRAAGIRRGDVVAVCNSLRAEVAFTVWGCAEVGAVIAGLDRNAPPAQTLGILEWLRPKLLLCHADLVAAAGKLVPCVVYATEGAEPIAGAPAFADWLDGAEERDWPEEAAADADEVGVLLLTSGTSGKRKCVETSHGSLYRTAMLLVRLYDLREDDILVSTGELHAIQGLRSPLVATVAAGASFVVISAAERRNPMALAEAIRRHRATVLITVPGTLQLLVQHQERLPRTVLSSLRTVVSVSSPLPRDLADAFRRRFGLTVLDQYGLTESPFAVGLGAADANGRSGVSVGLPLDTIVQIVDDDGAILPPGAIGEVRLYSENTMLGYRGPASEAGAQVKNGWVYSADIAVRDEEGFIKLLARRRDIIKGVSGDAVFPAEVEEVVRKSAGVRDAGVCGYTTPEGEERIALFIVPVEMPADQAGFFARLRKEILEALGMYRVPSRFELVDSLPRLHDGSLLRHELAARCR